MRVKVITASAGSGKTFRLSQILDEALSRGDARPECIVATTFTNKAAAELMERARTRLLESGNPKGAHALLASRIGTVNSVCGALVTDFAFELGLSPALQIIDENGANLELRRALSGVVTSEVRDNIERINQRFCKESNWQHEVRNVISAARANGISPDAVRKCGERSIAELDECLGDTLDGELLDAELKSAIAGALASIDTKVDTTKGTQAYVELLESTQRLIRRNCMTWGSWTKLATKAPTKKSAGLAVPVQEAAAAHVAHSGLRHDMHQFISQIFSIAADGLDVYQKHKREAGVIDFVDQEALALQLLRRDDVRAELRGQIDLVLIDEFQDTSPLQLAIFLELADLAKQSVWVGDPKQAIFGFRGTDPALMDAAIEALTSVEIDPDLVATATASVESQVETLSTSYRSRPALVASTSEIFAKAFAQHGMPEERTRLKAHMEKDPDGLGADYEHWRLEPKNAAKRASAVAGGVRDLLTGGRQVRSKETGRLRAIQAGDVAVLCRTNSQCAEVAEALVELGLRPVLPSMGLFDSAEGQLVLAGLRLWVDPEDAVAAAMVARLLVYADDLDSLADLAFEKKGAAAFTDVEEIANLLKRRKAATDLGSLDALHAVLTEVRARHWCARWGDSEQRLANLDAIRNHLVSFTGQAAVRGQAVTLIGFLQFVDDMLDDFGWQNTRHDSKALVGGSKAITVATWHGTKGLEWPVAILYGLESMRTLVPYGVSVLSDAESFDVKNPLAKRWIRFWPNVYTTQNQKGPVREAMEATDRFEELVGKTDREALRVLYVGWTRARDQLIFAVQANKFTKGLLGKLEEIDGDLIAEPEFGDVSVSWAGCPTPIVVRSYDEVEASIQTPVAGSVTVGRVPETPYPARQSPSAASALPCSISTTVDLGARFTVRDGSDMEFVGNAMHAFFAADRPEYAAQDRLAIATELLEGYRVAGSIAPQHVVEAADRLWTWLNASDPGAAIHREWPVQHRLATGTVVAGTADLLVRSEAGIVVIDHKSFPGSEAEALNRATGYSGQLQAYADAISASGQRVSSMWIHFPVLGLLAEVVPT